uniref:Uncharacterized protein n=1 Tax=Chelonoidis abingdonii TaxID=106734 RepID=A0A8C0J9I0_CHEAB
PAVVSCRFIARPLGRKLGLRDKVRLNAPPNPVLETFYATHSKDPKEGELISLSKQCDLPTRKVERWFRYRRNQDKPSLTTKFCEASWRFTFYFISFFTGLAVLYDPLPLVLQPLLSSVFWYYMLELSFYSSLVCTLPFDVKRKDLSQQIVHHAATIFLICFSYCANYLRIGTLVMVIHDASDCILEPTKIFNYMKWRRICDGLFIIFSAVFLITRLLIFPYKVLYNTYYYSMELYQPFFGYYFMNALLMILQLLHVFWSCLIIHMVYRFILRGTDSQYPSVVESSHSFPIRVSPAPAAPSSQGPINRIRMCRTVTTSVILGEGLLQSIKAQSQAAFNLLIEIY